MAHTADRLVNIAVALRDKLPPRLVDLGIDVPDRRVIAWGPPVIEDPQLLVQFVAHGTHEGALTTPVRSNIPTHPALSLRSCLFEVTVAWHEEVYVATNPISNLGADLDELERSACHGLQVAWALPKALLAMAAAQELAAATQGVSVGDVTPLEVESNIQGCVIAVDVQPAN